MNKVYISENRSFYEFKNGCKLDETIPNVIIIKALTDKGRLIKSNK